MKKIVEVSVSLRPLFQIWAFLRFSSFAAKYTLDPNLTLTHPAAKVCTRLWLMIITKKIVFDTVTRGKASPCSIWSLALRGWKPEILFLFSINTDKFRVFVKLRAGLIENDEIYCEHNLDVQKLYRRLLGWWKNRNGFAVWSRVRLDTCVRQMTPTTTCVWQVFFYGRFLWENKMHRTYFDERDMHIQTSLINKDMHLKKVWTIPHRVSLIYVKINLSSIFSIAPVTVIYCLVSYTYMQDDLSVQPSRRCFFKWFIFHNIIPACYFSINYSDQTYNRRQSYI